MLRAYSDDGSAIISAWQGMQTAWRDGHDGHGHGRVLVQFVGVEGDVCRCAECGHGLVAEGEDLDEQWGGTGLDSVYVDDCECDQFCNYDFHMV